MVILLALGQSHDCPSASETTLKDTDKLDRYPARTSEIKELFWSQIRG